MSKAHTTSHVDIFAKQHHVILERKSSRIDYALYHQPRWTDAHLDRLELKEVAGWWRKVKAKELLPKEDDVGEVEVVDLSVQQFFW